MRHSLGRRELLAKAPSLDGDSTRHSFRARLAAFATLPTA
jgi:hypothetical protein